MLAAAIAIHSVQLATNANGALLLTWFLDTCIFPARRTVLAPQLVPKLVHLCTHKVAYLTVLKVINQKLESEARDAILQALFFSADDQTLKAILADNTCGATLIFKVITTPFFDGSIRTQVTENIRNVLLQIKAQPSQGYKRLMDEVGLSTRNGSTGPGRDHSTHNRSQERHRPASNHSQMSQQFGGPYYAQMPQQFDLGMGAQRNDSMDSTVSPFTSFNMQAPMFPSGVPAMGIQPLAYNPMMARSAQPMQNFYPNMQAGFGSYATQGPSADQYRGQGMQNQATQNSNAMPGHTSFGPPGFTNAGMGTNGFSGYNGMPMNGMPGMGYVQQQEPNNGQRGRVGSLARHEVSR